MRFKILLQSVLLALALCAPCAYADGSRIALAPAQGEDSASVVLPVRDSEQTVMDRALELIGVRYRRGGNSPQTGFDCSGLVNHVFREVHGLILPHSSRAISKTGLSIAKDELKAGDLVLFHNLRKSVSHIGIYLGDNRFIHSPRPGQAVSIADLRERYWAKRYFGARRVEGD
jgi:cell wall-associated NlpC family hydrolase